MSNVNTSQNYIGLPAQSIATTTETAFVVPAFGTYGVLPSITLPAGVGLPLILDPDGQTQNATASPVVYSNSSVDGHMFAIRVILKLTFAAAATFIPKLYVATAATIAAGTQGTVANDQLVVTGATLTAGAAGTFNYQFTSTFLWDSTSQLLNGYSSTLASGTFTSQAGSTQRTVTASNNLNFILSGTFSVAGVNTAQILEFAFERI